ncbi:DUF3310 domain-containing protein [Staphylococcus simulans]|uniref:DUF3310 domain-containing protein n=1 Tax=Staphylococcus simulans TaxID=1286 RepID=UPI001E43F45F|nr:DUF3310 domain-containing protein [Staphylococcus simulans]MCD8914251.1 DUF3310 domain-containing protein [Staphylococcus simulans]
MREVKDLRINDRIILWQYRGLNVQDGHVGIVVREVIRDGENRAVEVQLDGIEEPFKLNDLDYFDKLTDLDKLTISYKKAESSDNVNHPIHYNQSKIETIEIMESLPNAYNIKTAICLSNVVKYIFRAPFKNGKEDLKKAQWYLQRAVNNFEGEK